jgi:uncharacterized protein
MGGPVRLIILQGTPFCNIDCRYCYLPDRDTKARIAPAVVDALARKLVYERMLDGSVEICWHAGEPLTVPILEYESLIGILNEGLKGVAKPQYSVQTNATLITPKWCEFFSKHSIRVGVSLDGPLAIHDVCRVDRAGKGTHARVMQGVRLLQEYGIEPYVIAVLHRESLQRPDEMFSFFQSTGVPEICFNMEEIEGINSRSSLDYPGVRADAERFFRRYFELISTTPGSHWLREFAHTLRRLCARKVNNAQIKPFEILTVDHRGNYSTFSPELHGVHTPRYPRFTLGSVFDEEPSFEQSVAGAPILLKEIGAGIDLCRSECPYFEVCGGGAPSNKVAENGLLGSSETLNCRLGVQAPIDAMLSLFGERISQLASSAEVLSEAWAGAASISPTEVISIS